MNVNSDHDEAVVVETLMMGLLVSRLARLKVKQKEDKGVFQTAVLSSVCACFCMCIFTVYI